MAIPYGTKLFETTVLARSSAPGISAAVKRAALIVIAFAGKRTGAYLSPTSITDLKGNTWQWEYAESEYRASGIAWTRSKSAMIIGSTIAFTWNGTPTYSWKSCHTFEGADDSATDQEHAFGTSSTPNITVDVAGSDWLAVGVIMAPYADAPTLTPLGSAISRDSNGTTTRPWAEFFSRNGTTGTTFAVGASGVTGGSSSVTAVSFPFQAMPSAATTNMLGGLIGI